MVTRAQPPARSSRIDKRTGSFVAYSLWWVTGIVMLFAGKDDPDIKYHAAQSIVFFGACSILDAIVSLIGLPVENTLVGFILFLIWLAIVVFAVIVWVRSMVWAWQRGGGRFDVPIVGDLVARYAERLAAAVK